MEQLPPHLDVDTAAIKQEVEQLVASTEIMQYRDCCNESRLEFKAPLIRVKKGVPKTSKALAEVAMKRLMRAALVFPDPLAQQQLLPPSPPLGLQHVPQQPAQVPPFGLQHVLPFVQQPVPPQQPVSSFELQPVPPQQPVHVVPLEMASEQQQQQQQQQQPVELGDDMLDWLHPPSPQHVPEVMVGHVITFGSDGDGEAVHTLLHLSSRRERAAVAAAEQRVAAAEQRVAAAEQRAAAAEQRAAALVDAYRRATALALDHPRLVVRMQELADQQDAEALVDWALGLPPPTLHLLLGRADDPGAADEAERALRRRDVRAVAGAVQHTNRFLAVLWHPWL
ncbi:hypothetical protein C2E21_8178 [Chlorella sorokiniana]|uniref:Uncharacterized protein n=1 Tax=Chlorella sorokiniana TaxID=3076 RepID=A0A2P6TFQ9_CHLSO|nr:hypothetical protein C2E21_8178 [Chlorella sorokiniana]|eukprot:PRW32951.1 hypothetical protein C2E21_8178 [Chlorella sorokiniana]